MGGCSDHRCEVAFIHAATKAAAGSYSWNLLNSDGESQHSAELEHFQIFPTSPVGHEIFPGQPPARDLRTMP